MKTTDKVITFPQAKKIAELGKEKGIELPGSQYVRIISGNNYVLAETQYIQAGETIPAYDVAEMMEIIKGYYDFLDFDEEWNVRRYENDNKRVEYASDTLAEALGELLIYLLTNDKI